jgi:glutamate carboxypeptidase
MTVDPLVGYLRGRKPAIVGLIRELVECESPSGDAAAVSRCADLLADRVGRAASIRTLPGGEFGKHLRCEFRLPGARKSGRILALGHSDTVWPVGTLRTMPFRAARGRLWGPGVFDMKAGLAIFVYAMEALRVLDIPVRREVLLQVNSDEEAGSASSRAYTEEAARGSSAVLVLEPAADLDGKVKTARKGVGEYTVKVRGIAAHAGLDFAAGANAVVEMGRLLPRIAGFTNLKRGITVSPGVIHGGSRINVVPDECRLDIDVRVPRAADARYLERRFASLKPFDRRCRVEVHGGLNRPPLERTAGVRALYRMARKLAAELGVELGEAAVGGGSDGNFTAALGVPTLDGLGAVGEGAHAAHESILLSRIVDRTALLARLVAAL